MAFEELTVEEALALLAPDADTVHVFTLRMTGADWSREAIEQAIRSSERRACITDGAFAALGHHAAFESAGTVWVYQTVPDPESILRAYRAALTTPEPAQELNDG